jgi:hypothetical protein
MRKRITLCATALLAVTGGCSQLEAAAGDDHFTCAALISAADRLIVTRRVPPDDGMANDRLVAMMTHLNSWAIPQRMPEREAFAAVNAERERLLEAEDPDAIMTRARACDAAL